MAGSEDVGDLTLMDEDRRLSRSNDLLGSVFDLISISRIAPNQRVLAVVDPFDDINEFCAELVEECHLIIPLSLVQDFGQEIKDRLDC